MPPRLLGVRLLTALFLLSYTTLTLGALSALRRPGLGYSLDYLTSDLICGGIALVLVVGLLRDWRWAVPALLLLTGLRILSRLWEARRAIARTGWTEATLPGPVWLLRLALLFGIILCLLVLRRAAQTAGDGPGPS